MPPDQHRLAREIEALKPLAVRLFDELRDMSRDRRGVTRPSYGEKETEAAEIIRRAAHGFGLSTRFDAGGNLLVARAGSEKARGGVITGSHLDSVLEGGNFDGAAGVVAGLLVLVALEKMGASLSEPVTLIGTRGEESAWFSVHHIGARAALGLLDADEIDTAKRYDTGRTLAEYMAEAGCDLDAVRAGVPTFDAKAVRAYLELHIEQGPVLVHEATPVGIVSGIRGNVRVRDGRCYGEYAHSGAVPRKMRRDAFLALAEFAGRCEAEWEAIEADGGDLVLTFGKAHTDTAVHSHNKVPGEVRFVVDVRSHEMATLDRVEAFLHRTGAEIAERRGVDMVLDHVGRVTPAPMDAGIRRIMTEGAEALGVSAMQIASGGGHDAGDFANLGVPAGMVFVRNPNGSHNPDEAMDIDDFIEGTKVLGWTLARLAS
jgi:N-carbamoyl-L-amino-acid hydrolase